MWPWHVKMPTQSLLMLLLLLMLLMRIMLATVCCILGSWGLVIKPNFCSDFQHKVSSRFWSWSSGRILKLEFGQYFAADVLQRLWRWILVEMLKLGLFNILNFKFSWHGDVWLEFWSKCLFEILKMKFELVIWPKKVILERWTQPSGPLCLWQCFIFEDVRDGEIPNLRRGGLHFGENLSLCTLNRRCTFPERSCSSSRNRSSYSERRRGGLRWNNIMVPVGRGRAASQHLTLSLWILFFVWNLKINISKDYSKLHYCASGAGAAASRNLTFSP